MGLLDWFRASPPPVVPKRSECDFCSAPATDAELGLLLDGASDLNEFAVNSAKSTYLLQCPKCGQFYGGHGYTPHYLWRLTPEEAAECFPLVFTSLPGKSSEVS